MKKWFLFPLIVSAALSAERIGIVGGGGAGLAAAWLLEEEHSVTLYEEKERLGGHADSIEVVAEGKNVVVEAGFEFFNEVGYPNFLRLLRHFDVPLNSFTLVSTFYHVDGKDTIILPPYHDGKVEWESIEPKDISRLLRFKTLLDASRPLVESQERGLTFGAFCSMLDLGDHFKESFLYPFLAAGWGLRAHEIKGMSAYNTVKYLVQGFLVEDYQWFEVEGGLQRYIRAVQNSLTSAEVRLNSKIARITYDGHYNVEEDDGTVRTFDHLIIATNASDAAELLKAIPERQDTAALLRGIRYIDTIIAIHGDPRFMPPDVNDWRVVNIRYNGTDSAISMYKHWKGVKNLFKTWLNFNIRASDDKGSAVPSPLYKLVEYKHAVNDLDYFHVQRAIQLLQGRDNLWFAGNWTFDNDSHESAIHSAIKIAEHLSPESERLLIFK